MQEVVSSNLTGPTIFNHAESMHSRELFTPKGSWWWPLLLAGTIVFASGQSQVASPGLWNFDKLAHFCVFGLLASLVWRCRPQRRWMWWAVAAVSLFGATDEWHQSLTPGRSMEWGDWICDTLGAALAVSLYARWTRYRGLLEWRWRGQRPVATVPVVVSSSRVPHAG